MPDQNAFFFFTFAFHILQMKWLKRKISSMKNQCKTRITVKKKTQQNKKSQNKKAQQYLLFLLIILKKARNN